MVVAFGVHSASKEKWKIENLKTENEEKITIFFTKKVFFLEMISLKQHNF